MALTPEQQTEIDAAIATAKAELRAELLKTRATLEQWVVAHPLLAFRIGTLAGILGGGFTVYGVLRVLG